MSDPEMDAILERALQRIDQITPDLEGAWTRADIATFALASGFSMAADMLEQPSLIENAELRAHCVQGYRELAERLIDRIGAA